MIRLLLRLIALLALFMPLACPAKPLRVVGDSNYPPYLFLGPDGRAQGYEVDAWKLWEQKTGIKVELVATTWADAKRRLQQGQADVIDILFATPERRNLYDFSSAFATVHVGIYADRGVTGLTDVSSLHGFVVGVEQGDACVERLRNAGVPVRLYTGYAQIIAAASSGEIRIFCMDEYPANYYLYRTGVYSRFVEAFEFYSDQLRQGVRKGDSATLALVNRGMARISTAERQRLQDKWMGKAIGPRDYVTAFKVAAAVLAIAGIALLIWVYTLRRIVRRRTRDLEYLAHFDPMTGLPNRTLLADRIDHKIGQGEVALALLLVNLDNFKRINEGLGHPMGDKLLREVADRLSALHSATGTVARLTADYFVLVLRTADVNHITALAEQARREIARPFVLSGKEVFLSASVGVSLYPEDGIDSVALLKNADAAMFRAKQNGRNGISFYSASLSAQASQFLELGASIRKALEQDEFEVWYQPQTCLATGRMVGVEALVRWRRGARLVLPGDFIPYAEEHGLIESLGGWVLRTACRQLAAWRAQGLPAIRMAVNLSPRQMSCAGLVAAVEHALSESGFPAELLDLEITESTVVTPDRAMTTVLNDLRALGVGIAVDDFGTGYSSLSYLRHLPVSLIKVDKSFLTGVPEERKARQVVRAIVAMAHALGMQVVAEGVEQRAQAEFLAEIGCDFAQGWHFGHPARPADIQQLLNGALAVDPTAGPRKGQSVPPG